MTSCQRETVETGHIRFDVFIQEIQFPHQVMRQPEVQNRKL